jgi:hypothetical protein
MQRENMLIAGLLAAIILCVGTALAQDFAPQTGFFIKGGEMNGMCRLDIINNGENDAVAYLSTMQKKIVAGVYIRGGDFFNLTGIDAGSYELYFKQGQSWNNSTGRFATNATSSRMQEPLTFETQKTPEGIRYTWGQVTLEEVPDGNAVVVPVSEEDFPA